MSCKEENCNYYIWYTMLWFDCKLFKQFNVFFCVITLPIKCIFMIPWGLFCIPGYKYLYKNKKYKQLKIYHV